MTQDNHTSQKSSTLSRIVKLTLLAIIIFPVGWLLFSPVPFDPLPQTIAPSRAGQAPFISNNLLAAADKVTVGEGPEGVAIDAQGRIVTGLEDGRIIRQERDGSINVIGETGGRPLGMDFDARGRLIIADAVKGLVALDNGNVTVLADRFDGQTMLFVDDLSIDARGRIWFSDASQRYGFGHDSNELFEAYPSGRLMVFDPARNNLSVALDNLYFANGVAISKDQSFVLVNETYAARVTRYWLAGPRRGETDVFIDGLPGFPDNITEAPNGDFWLSLVAPRTSLTDRLASSPFFRKVIWRLTQLIGTGDIVQEHVWAVRLSPEGEVKEVLEDATGHLKMMTSVLEHENKLYLGSLTEPFVGIYALDDNKLQNN